MKAKKIKQSFFNQILLTTAQSLCAEIWYWFVCTLSPFCTNVRKVKHANLSTIAFIRLSYSDCFEKNFLSLTYLCQCPKSHRNQSVDWQCRTGFYFTETLSQTEMSLVSVSLVVFFQQHSSQCYISQYYSHMLVTL